MAGKEIATKTSENTKENYEQRHTKYKLAGISFHTPHVSVVADARDTCFGIELFEI